MIIWLATYPRSGNALLRTILHETMGYDTYINPEFLVEGTALVESVRVYTEKKTIDEPWEAFYQRHRETPERVLIKTHELRSDALPAIYLLRDGRQVLFSYYKYYQEMRVSSQLPCLLELVLGADWFGGWSQHYKAWHSASHPRLLTVRFEELVHADEAVLRKLADFIGYEGEIRSWRNPLAEKQAWNPGAICEELTEWTRPPEWTERVDRAFWAVHGELMRELGYGKPGEIPEIPEEERRDWQALAGIAQQHAVFRRDMGKLQGEVDSLHRNLSNHSWVRQHARNLKNSRPTFFKSPQDWIWDRLLESNRCQPGSLLQYKPRRYKAFYRPKRRSLAAAEFPSFAIAVPSYNQVTYVKSTVESILGQHYPRLELAVMDAGSTDGSAAVLEPLRDQLAAFRSHKDEGQAAAINEGLGKAKGEICAWLNSDDLFLPGSLHLVGRYFAAHPEVDAVYGYRLIINSQGFEVGRWFMPPHEDEDLRWFDYVPQETLFFRRSLWDRVGGLTSSFQFALDWDLLVRFIEVKAKIVRLPYFLGAFRAHDLQKTSTLMATTGQWEMSVIRQRTLGRIPALEEIKKRQLAFRGRASIWAHLYKHKIRF